MNAPRLGHDDPDMIHPGEVVHLPAATLDASLPVPAVDAPVVPASTPDAPKAEPHPEAQLPVVLDAPAPVDDPVAPVVPAVPAEPGASPVTPSEPIATTPAAPAAPAPPAAAPSAMPLTPTLPASVPATSATPSSGRPSVPIGTTEIADASGAEDGQDSSSPVLVGLGGAVLLGAGALGVLQARRRHQLRRAMVGARLQPPAPSDIAAETLLRSLDAPERALRLDLALRSVAHQLRGSSRYVIGAILAPDAALTVLLDGPAAPPAPPWESVDRDDRWALASSVTPLDLAPAARRAAQPCPALVHLGTAGTDEGWLGELFLDVEAIGVLRIEAPDEEAGSILRVIAASLSASPLGETLRLVTTGVDDETHLGNLNAESAASLDESLEVAAATVSSTPSSILAGRTFAARAAAIGCEAWEPIVIVSRGRTTTSPRPPPLGCTRSSAAVAVASVSSSSATSTRGGSFVRPPVAETSAG
jgi:hypothetical protein